jgi:hypothetical protein
MLTIVEALALLTPYDVNKRKERLGPPHDGGYVLLPELFMPGQPVFSYGVNGEYNFDIEMASRGHPIYMFDHTIDGINNPTNNSLLRFVKEGVSGSQSTDPKLNTLDNHLNTYAQLEDNDLILKMDVEGAEYETFGAVSEAGLNRFQQIVFEIHSLHSLGDEKFRIKFVRMLEKINRSFTLFHVHANNFDGSDTYTFLSGVPVCNLIELSYVRTNLVERRPSETVYPTYLDYSNVHPMDKKLWFYPFIPTIIKPSRFFEADILMTLRCKT